MKNFHWTGSSRMFSERSLLGTLLKTLFDSLLDSNRLSRMPLSAFEGLNHRVTCWSTALYTTRSHSFERWSFAHLRLTALPKQKLQIRCCGVTASRIVKCEIAPCMTQSICIRKSALSSSPTAAIASWIFLISFPSDSAGNLAEI